MCATELSLLDKGKADLWRLSVRSHLSSHWSALISYTKYQIYTIYIYHIQLSPLTLISANTKGAAGNTRVTDINMWAHVATAHIAATQQSLVEMIHNIQSDIQSDTKWNHDTYIYHIHHIYHEITCTVQAVSRELAVSWENVCKRQYFLIWSSLSRFIKSKEARILLALVWGSLSSWELQPCRCAAKWPASSLWPCPGWDKSWQR